MKISMLCKQITQYVVVSACAITSFGAFQVEAQTCAATAITPYVNANNTGWVQASSATISSGNTVIFGPQPTSGGTWSWSGCGTSGTSREQTKSITSTCTATATYKNSCGTTSTKSFSITVSSAAYANCTTTTSDPDGDGWGWENNKTCVVVNRTAMQITGSMGVGWNLGNSLDSSVNETNWGNPKTTKAMIDKVKSAGFTTLRVPVTWDDHVSGSSYTIASSWLDRVEEVANYGIANDMFVIINIHHNNGWEAPTYGNEANAKDRLTKLWQQIATRFNKYGDKVIFETMNEPRSGDDWWGVQENFDVVNRLNTAALSTIRATGGNNAKRLVMIPGYVAGANDHQIDAITLPNDSKYAISTHAYFPFGFALDSTGTSVFTTGEVDDVFARLNTKFISKGVAVVMGEWASTNKNNLSERVKHAEYYVKKAKSVKIPTIWWDNNNPTAGSGDAMGLLKRSDNTWYYPTIVTAIMNGNK